MRIIIKACCSFSLFGTGSWNFGVVKKSRLLKFLVLLCKFPFLNIYFLNSNILRLLFTWCRNPGKKLEIYLWFYVAVVREGKKVKVLICLEELDLVWCDGWSLLFSKYLFVNNICFFLTCSKIFDKVYLTLRSQFVVDSLGRLGASRGNDY